MLASNNHPQRIRPAHKGGSYAVRPLQKASARRDEPKMSQKTRETFEAISSPKNAALFTVQAALKAFKHTKA